MTLSIKTIRLLTVVTFAALFVVCVKLPIGAGRIEGSKIRLLSYVFEPAEAAPGDTVQCTIYAEGLPLTSVVITVSQNVLKDAFGLTDTAVGFQPVTSIAVPGSIQNPDSITVRFSFVIPRDFMRQTIAIPEQWTTLLQTKIRDSLPASIKNLTKTDIITSLENSNGEQGQALAIIELLKAQFFSAFIRFSATFNGSLITEGDFTVRYQSALPLNPFAQVNHNPAIHWMGIYKITGDAIQSFDPAQTSPAYQLYCFYHDSSARLSPDVIFSDTVAIDKGYTYFLAVDNNIYGADTVRDDGVYIDSTGSIVRQKETYQFMFFYRTPILTGVPDFFLGGSFSDNLTQIVPPTNEQVKNITFYARCNDFFIGETNRPTGYALQKGSVVFTYTADYLNSIRK